MPESDLYSELILEATRLGHRLFRNNRGVGNYKRRDGSQGFVKFGLAEGASDLVGYTTAIYDTTGEPETVAIFTAIEVKRHGARTDKELLAKQQRFVEAVKAAGGIAGFVESVQDYRKLVGAE